MKSVISSEPAAEPVTTTEAKSWMRVDISTDDTLIDALVKTARIGAEQYLGGRVLVTQTWKTYLDLCELNATLGAGKVLQLPKADLVSVTSIKYRSDDDQALADFSTWAAANYLVDTADRRILLAQEGSLPTVYAPYESAIEITAVYGFGAAAAVPELIKSAIKTHAADMYENRTGPKQFSGTVMNLLNPYRILSA